MSQPMNRLSAASATRVSMRARAPAKMIVSCGSHSSVAPAPTVKSMRCEASDPPLRYHLPAPGVVNWAWALASTVAAMASDSVTFAAAFSLSAFGTSYPSAPRGAMRVTRAATLAFLATPTSAPLTLVAVHAFPEGSVERM